MERFEAEKTKMTGLQDANETMKSKLDRLQIARKITVYLIVAQVKYISRFINSQILSYTDIQPFFVYFF